MYICHVYNSSGDGNSYQRPILSVFHLFLVLLYHHHLCTTFIVISPIEYNCAVNLLPLSLVCFYIYTIIISMDELLRYTKTYVVSIWCNFFFLKLLYIDILLWNCFSNTTRKIFAFIRSVNITEFCNALFLLLLFFFHPSVRIILVYRI